MRACFGSLLLAVFLLNTGGARAAGMFPPIDGDVSGDLRLTMMSGAPALHWKATVERTSVEARHVVLTTDGEGARARVEADVDVGSGDGTWKIVECSLDATRWFPLLVAQASGISVTAAGQLTVVGHGPVKAGQFSGSVEVSWNEGALRDSGGTWKLEGITAAGSVDFSTAGGGLRSARPVSIEVRTITTNRFGARNLNIRAELENVTAVRLLTATVEIAGGQVAVEPTTVQLKPLAAAIGLKITHVGLQDVAALVPGTVAEAHGRVDGEVHVAWSASAGFKLGSGTLSVAQDEPAELRLAPSPGLITGSIPKEKLDQILKYYPGLAKIEMGEIPIRAELLDVSFTPTGDAEGRTASVHLAGGPIDPNLRAPIDLTVNVRGPLESLIKLGTSPRLHFGAP
jgi:hypothetical protein